MYFLAQLIRFAHPLFLTAFLGILFGLAINGGTIPGQSDTHLLTALEAIPGAVLGMAAVYLEGIRREEAA